MLPDQKPLRSGHSRRDLKELRAESRADLWKHIEPEETLSAVSEKW